MVNKTAAILGPQLDLDPDVVAALGDDFDFVIQHLCENDFILQGDEEQERKRE